MSESSSEEENADRFKEAAWSFGSQDVKICGEEKVSSGRQSHRTEVSKHEHDGNELGTTPEFRSHVAKKLGAILDGCISEVCSDTVASQPCQPKSTDEEKDEGFRLFFTSAPGKWMEREELSPPQKKRRPVPSSSDSDSEMEMRFREAAVSVSDLLAPSAPPLAEKKSGETEDGGENDTADTVPKKRKRKRKRKMATEASEKVIVQFEKQSNGDPDEQHTVTENLTKKKKKKKRKKLEDG
ncbi:protein CUSTOS [Triplophysa rosa]|uniref:Protein CUSTOS n=1 Tax=Triplophysa rosa TaxID=992332 RepID=A0A9W7WFY6_TRIRA|nr:protein CUSTOS [Triplophysa rosa]KAI7797779.1 hypothetical protein IRJ41_019663 [Triplophysa rosa]